MGREWYCGDKSIMSSKSKKKSNEANGCITALYHFFRYHHFYFCSRHHQHQTSTDSHTKIPKGLVAPRNSLDLTEVPPLSTNYKLGKESLNINVRGKLGALLVDTSSTKCNSPRTKTPNVVARLMGLDLLPDNLEDLTRSSSYTVREHRLSGNISGTRSLPVSPRISIDSENRRLSLHQNRENKHEEVEGRRLKELKQDEGSPSSRQMVKQVKERVTTRKFGMDLTNLLENKTRARAAQNNKENTTRTNPTFKLRQDHISQQPTKVTLKENLKGVNESKSSPPTPCNRNNQRKAFISISTNSKSSDCCDHLEKKKCKKTKSSDCCDHLEKKKGKKIAKSNKTTNIYVAASAFSSTERPQKQMKRAEEPERIIDTKKGHLQMYIYEKKLPQEPPSSNFYAPGMKKIKEEDESIVAEIEQHIVDTLVQETVETLSFEDLNANAILSSIIKERMRFKPLTSNKRFNA